MMADDNQPNDYIHRDDLPMELVEEIEKHFAEMMPGFKVVFAGDAPGGEQPEGLEESVKMTLALWADCFVKGICSDCCETKVHGWPTEEEIHQDNVDEDREFELPEGWDWLESDQTMMGFPIPPRLICPACAKKVEGQGLILERLPTPRKDSDGHDESTAY